MSTDLPTNFIGYDDLAHRHIIMTLNRSAITIGESSSSTPELLEFEVIDNLNGNQLAFIRAVPDRADAAWDEIILKAHHQLLELNHQAAEQAKLDKEWSDLLCKAQDRLENINRYMSGDLVNSRNVSREDLLHMAAIVDSLTNAGLKLDLIDDPE